MRWDLAHWWSPHITSLDSVLDWVFPFPNHHTPHLVYRGFVCCLVCRKVYIIEILVQCFISEIVFDPHGFCIVLQNNWDFSVLFENCVSKLNYNLNTVIITHTHVDWNSWSRFGRYIMYYCDYNVIVNIFCIHIGIWGRKYYIALGNSADMWCLAVWVFYSCVLLTLQLFVCVLMWVWHYSCFVCVFTRVWHYSCLFVF